MPGLVLFDFDGTITTQDTFTPFILNAVSRKRKLFGLMTLGPMLVAYKWGFLRAKVMRSAASRLAFAGRPEAEIRAAGHKHAREHLPGVVRKDVLERIEWHQSRGDRVVVVSASLDVYLSAWCEGRDLDLICTELEARSGVMTGRSLSGDCSGREKARRVVERYDLESYSEIFAYGDSQEDLDMLRLASVRFLQGRRVEW